MSPTVNIKLKFFAYAREMVGEKEMDMELEAGTTVGELFRLLTHKYPGLREMQDHVIIAVNRSTCPLTRELRDGDLVAVLPPVSGG